MGLGELEEARAVRVERLGRELLDLRLEAGVGRCSLDSELRLGGRQRPLELDDVLKTAPPLDESRAHREENAERAEDEAYDECDDDH